MTPERKASPEAPERFWLAWLRLVSVFVVAFGLALVLFPTVAREWFSLLVYSSTDRIAAFGPEAVEYIGLAHAVMGSVMVGWGVAFLLILRGPMKRNPAEGVVIFAISLSCWFVPDTIYSIASGFWQNAAQNVVFGVLFAIPLAVLFLRSRTPME